MNATQSGDSALATPERQRVRAAYSRRPYNDTRYSWVNTGHLFTVQRRERATLRCLRRNGFDQLADKRILDIGCGEGYWLREFVKWGAQPSRMHGVELLEHRVLAGKRLGPEALS